MVLADSRKFDLVAPAFVFGLKEVQTIVTDSGVRRSTVEQLEEVGVEAIIA